MLKINDANNFRRTAAGLCLIGGPLLVLIGGLVTPWEESDTLAAYLTALAESPTRAQISAVLLYLGFLLFVPGLFGMIHLIRTRAVVLGHAAGILAIWGWVTLPGLLVMDFQDLSMAESLDVGQAVAISERAQGYVGALILTLPPSGSEGNPPIKVNAAAGKATNLNVDKLDGKDSASYFSGSTYDMQRHLQGGDSFGGSAQLVCDDGDVPVREVTPTCLANEGITTENRMFADDEVGLQGWKVGWEVPSPGTFTPYDFFVYVRCADLGTPHQ